MKDRINKIMQQEGLTPGQFAELVGIQRSAVSHLVTGRNKPSLEVIQKILNTFRTLSSDWLILGVGPMYRHDKDKQQQQSHSGSLFDFDNESSSVNDEDRVVYETKRSKSTQYEQQRVVNREEPQVKNNTDTVPVMVNNNNIVAKTVKKIIVFYSDNTFDEFNK